MTDNEEPILIPLYAFKDVSDAVDLVLRASRQLKNATWRNVLDRMSAKFASAGMSLVQAAEQREKFTMQVLEMAKQRIDTSRGYEPIDGGYIATGPRRPKVSKAAIRADLDKALTADPLITKIIRCQCGHQGKVRIPLSRRNGPFTCRCGRKTR